MLEIKTFEQLMADMLSRVSDSLDKREGSVIYTAVAPCAAELAQAYINLALAMQLAFATTSSGEYLERRAAEMDVNRLPSVAAVKRGLFTDTAGAAFDIPIGSRFRIDDMVYVATSRIGIGVYAMLCETAGEVGNIPAGEMLPISYISGLAKAILTADILTEGQDTESDTKLLTRYLLRVRMPATSGNVYHYKQWALEVPGVGDSKIFPLWNGNGTVKVVIIDTDKLPASPALVDAAKQHIEEVRPIGATVTVVSGTAKAINISATLTLATGHTIAAVTASFTAAVTEYLKSTAFVTSYISYAKLGTVLLGTEGVLDYAGLSINGGATNIALGVEEIPVLGTVTLGCSTCI